MKKKPKNKIEKTLHEFKVGSLHSGSKKGPKVTSRKQAIAIALNQERKAGGKVKAKRGRPRNPMRGRIKNAPGYTRG